LLSVWKEGAGVFAAEKAPVVLTEYGLRVWCQVQGFQVDITGFGIRLKSAILAVEQYTIGKQGEGSNTRAR
jgi:hypothetical protein